MSTLEVSPPSAAPLLSRGETRPVFGSPAVRIPRAPDLWLCVPASRPVCLYRKNASTDPVATTMPANSRPHGASLEEQNHDDGPSVRHCGSSLSRRARDMSSSAVVELTPLRKATRNPTKSSVSERHREEPDWYEGPTNAWRAAWDFDCPRADSPSCTSVQRGRTGKNVARPSSAASSPPS
jgi:hypothetical protein